MSETAKTYQQNFDTLQTIVQQLQQNDTLDIDQLIPMVDEANQAYQACLERINQVENALNERLETTNEQVKTQENAE